MSAMAAYLDVIPVWWLRAQCYAAHTFSDVLVPPFRVVSFHLGTLGRFHSLRFETKKAPVAVSLIELIKRQRPRSKY
jgi:hypothetical protein